MVCSLELPSTSSSRYTAGFTMHTRASGTSEQVIRELWAVNEAAADPRETGAYPFPLITAVGNNVIAVRPVQFRIVNKSAPFGQAAWARTSSIWFL